MAKLQVINLDNSKVGDLDLDVAVFEAPIRKRLFYESVKQHLASRRRGTHSTKTRHFVSGGGAKPFRQKGTGRARAGTIRSPIFRGGGVVFGPRPRSYRKDFPTKMRRVALRSALSSRAKTDSVAVIADPQFSEPKTKQFAAILDNMSASGTKVLFVTEKPTPELIKSARNIPRVRVRLGGDLTTYDVLWSEKLVVTEGALKAMVEVFK